MSAEPDLDPTLEHALAYAAAGWPVIPIRPGHKYPAAIGRWQDAATTNTDTIRSWWTGLYRGHGIGIAPGQLPDGRWLLVIDIDDHDIDGHATWADLCHKHGTPPDTIQAVTGGGGLHLLFAAPVEVRNGRLGPGIDIRGHGGQILVEPSIHPNGQPYTWEHGHAPWDIPVADAPDWLLELVLGTPPKPPAVPATADSAGDRPGDQWAAQTSWTDLLEADGWTLHHVDRDGEHHWTRPGKEVRDGTSATTGYADTDLLKVFTTSIPELEPDTTYTKLGYLAAIHHHGDYAAAADALRTSGFGTPTDHRPLVWTPDLVQADGTPAATTDLEALQVDADHDDGRTGWEPVELGPYLADDYDPPKPTVGPRIGGGHLFYRGRANALYAPSGHGKSWVALWACATELDDDHDVVFIDLEDHAASVAGRLRALGVTTDTLAARFHYIAPEAPWTPAAAVQVAQLVEDHQATIVVIDSTGEAMALDGAKPNDDDDTARFFRRMPRYLANLDAQPAVILTDHVPKDDNRPRGMAIGSQRKRAALDGVSYDVTSSIAPARGVDGKLELVVGKDRNGAYQRGNTVAHVRISANEAGTNVAIVVEAPDKDGRPIGVMEAVSSYLEGAEDPQSKTQIRANVTGNDATIGVAIDELVNAGYVRRKPRSGRGGGDDHALVRPFRADSSSGLIFTEEPVDNPVEEVADEPF